MKRIIGAILLACTMCLSSCKNREVKETLPLCRVMTVAAKAVEINESYSASIQGRQDIDIYPQISGTITELRVYEGKTVRKGEVMFVIDQVPYRAAWRKTMADVHAAEAQVETARLEYRSKQQLLRKKSFQNTICPLRRMPLPLPKRHWNRQGLWKRMHGTACLIRR